VLANIDEGLIGPLVTKVQAETFENSLNQAEAYRISVTITSEAPLACDAVKVVPVMFPRP
jgi:hypothetical protein